MSATLNAGNEAIEQLPTALRQWMTLERFHLHKAELRQRVTRDPAFDIRYFPQHCGVFRLPCFLLPRKYLHVYGSEPRDCGNLSFLEGELAQDRVLFPVHPSALDHYREVMRGVAARDADQDDVVIWALPTSSTRTVLAWPDGEPRKSVFIKTSLHSPIFGDRRVLRMRAGRSVGLSALMDKSRGEISTSLHWLTENVAFTLRQPPQTGAIIRGMPPEVKDGRVRLAPLFSLLGGQGSYEPLLLTILQRTGIAPLQFVHDVLCKPFATLWTEMTMKLGLVLEAHGQDLLLELSPDLLFNGRFYYRDFEGLQVDWALRRHLGISEPRGMPIEWLWHDAYDAWGKYRYADLVWYKWRVSLGQYLHGVLHETECSLREWHRRGLIAGPICEQNEVTMIFSRCIFDAVEQLFGVSVGPPFNIRRSLNRFLILLAKLRSQSMGVPPPKIAGLAA